MVALQICLYTHPHPAMPHFPTLLTAIHVINYNNILKFISQMVPRKEMAAGVL